MQKSLNCTCSRWSADAWGSEELGKQAVFDRPKGMKIEGASPTELFEGGRMLCNFFKHQADLFILQYEYEEVELCSCPSTLELTTQVAWIRDV